MQGVTKDVVRDLLPVYVAGEASADTKALVESFIAADPDLRAEVESARQVELPAMPAAGDLTDLEMKTLQRTRQLLGWRNWLMAGSLFCTLLPLTFASFGGKIVFLLARDLPIAGLVSVIAAIIGWIGYLRVCRLLQTTGFEPKKTLWTRLAWALVGAVLGASASIVAQHWTGASMWTRAMTPIGMLIALRAGEGFGQVGKVIVKRRR